MDMGIWVGAFWVGVIFLSVMYVLLSVVWGAALARWTRFPLWVGIVLGLLVPVLGPAVAAIVFAVRQPRVRRVRRSWLGRWEALLLLLPASGLVASLGVPWWRLQIGQMEDVLLFPGGHFLDVLVIVSLVFYVVAFALFVVADLVHLSAIVLLVPVAFWAGFSWLVYSVTDATQRTLGGVAAMTYTVGDALSMFGIDLGSITVPGVTDADVTDLADQVRLGVGDGLAVVAVVTLMTMIWMLRQAFRRVVLSPQLPAGDADVRSGTSRVDSPSRRPFEHVPTVAENVPPAVPYAPPTDAGQGPSWQGPSWSLPPSSSDPSAPPAR